MPRRPTERRRSRPPTQRQYPRTARLNTLLQQVVADHLERVDDERLGLLTVTGVEVDNDLNRARVFISALADGLSDDELLEILETEHRKPIQAAIAREARLRKTPEVVFEFDPGVRAGARIEDILATLRSDGDGGIAKDDDNDGDGDGGGALDDGPAGGATGP